MGFTLAITGRPNVGKSTFFNRLLEQRKAIVDDIRGVTRDRQYGISDWNGKSFNVIDTGGFVPQSNDIFEREIKKQVLVAVEEANALIFMVDGSTQQTRKYSRQLTIAALSTLWHSGDRLHFPCRQDAQRLRRRKPFSRSHGASAACPPTVYCGRSAASYAAPDSPSWHRA